MSGPVLAWLQALISAPETWLAVSAAVANVVRDPTNWMNYVWSALLAITGANRKQAAQKAEAAHAMAMAAAGPNVAAAVKASKSSRKGPGR
jgi:ATP-dependent Clp protease adapter protein ClpS